MKKPAGGDGGEMVEPEGSAPVISAPDGSASPAAPAPWRQALRWAVRLVCRRTFLYGAAGFLLGLSLTVAGYLVDYFALYRTMPERLGFALVRGLHAVTPVHYFADFFALLLGALGGLAGWLQDQVIYYTGHLEDLVAKRTRALRRSEERYALAARGSNDGLWDWDLRRHRVYFSPRWKQNLGYGRDQVGETPADWLDRVHPKDRARLEERIRNHLAGADANFSVEYRMRHADGTYRWMLARGMAVRNRKTGQAYRMAGSQTDIDDRKKMEQQLMFLALHDSLTELPNRTLFVDRVGHAFDRARRQGRRSTLAVLFLDVDRFKTVNDSLGHILGDRLIVQIAGRILDSLKPFGEDPEAEGAGGALQGRGEFSCTLARMGGDEFTILLEDIATVHDATRVVQHLESRFREPFHLENRELFVTLSTGVALGPRGYRRAEDLLRDADTAMYRAKANGRARFEVFDQEMLAEVQGQLRLETDLHQALARGEVRVVYQPVVELETGRLVGLEALARWDHPERGWILPEEFIPLAEETGRIQEIGRQVFAEACRQLSRWDRENPDSRRLTLGVNLSPRQLFDPEFLAEFRSVVSRTGVDPERVCLEVTESTLIRGPEEVAEVLKRAKKTGFRVAIDDFGTGYSSLSLLQKLPVDILKIDQSFVSRLGGDARARPIVETILGLARALGLEVIAEGIETGAQLRHLLRAGCRLGQGNLFSPPLEAEPLEARLASGAGFEPGEDRGRAAARSSN
ncbi:MAG: EAL domain-containing protein [Acidobacteria bacterium]|nr:EAL domain-containing protein [Acidobacteriota bacterium]